MVYRVTVIATMLLICASLARGNPPNIRRAAEPIPGEYIVVFKDVVLPDHVPAVANEMVSRHGGRTIVTFRHGLRGFGAAINEAGAARLASDPRVAFVEENSVGHLSYQVEYYNDAIDRWHLNRIDQRSSIPSYGVYAYGWSNEGHGVDVYVLDSGIWSSHAEFTNVEILPGADYATTDGFPTTGPCGAPGHYYNGGHGTAVASLIAGKSVGIARRATLIPVVVGPCNQNPSVATGHEFTPTALGVLYGINWAIASRQSRGNRPSVINLSFYFTQEDPVDPACSGSCLPALEQNLINALNAGFVVVTSANNQSQNRCGTQSPARFSYGMSYCPLADCVITVGGTNRSDGRYSCSTCAAHDAGSNYGPCVTIYAPGHEIKSAHLGAFNAFRNDPYWLLLAQNRGDDYYASSTVESVSSGTSFSAAIVSGIAARLLSHPARNTWRAYDFWQYLRSYSTNIGNIDGLWGSEYLVYISVYD